MKILPVIKEIQASTKKAIINNKKNTMIKPIKNYTQYMKEYGLK